MISNGIMQQVTIDGPRLVQVIISSNTYTAAKAAIVLLLPGLRTLRSRYENFNGCGLGIMGCDDHPRRQFFIIDNAALAISSRAYLALLAELGS